jgi:hypothetical protein
MMKAMKAMKSGLKALALAALMLASLALTGCSGNVGVGMSVGVPIGDHGYISVGGNRWY